MKKIFTTVFMLVLLFGILHAQPRTIGARIGGNMEVSYQHNVLSYNMLEISAGVSNYFPRNVDGLYKNYGYVGVTAMFDWIFNISGGWNWYLGPGVGVGYYWRDYYGPNHINLNVCGQIGIEYQFNIPLTLSLDWRPSVNVLGFFPAIHQDENYRYKPYFGDFTGIAIGVRYRFQ